MASQPMGHVLTQVSISIFAGLSHLSCFDLVLDHTEIPIGYQLQVEFLLS